MIFATVGTQLPFDRLLTYLDAIAGDVNVDIVAQCGETKIDAKNIQVVRRLKPADFDRMVSSSELVVAHAGIGTILRARSHGKHLIVVPRRADLKEHRNDHQRATAKQLLGTAGVSVAETEAELRHLILVRQGLAAGVDIASASRQRLLRYLRDQLHSEAATGSRPK